jgi:biopolymer transport protein ExbD
MITRPLDLASRMRPEPRSFDWLFYVNGLALVLFFTLFGSPFVLAPGLSAEFRLPVTEGANSNAKPITHSITIQESGQILTPYGNLKEDQLEAWLATQAKTTKAPVLLVRGDAKVRTSVMFAISGMARKVGFIDVTWASVDAADSARTGGR